MAENLHSSPLISDKNMLSFGLSESRHTNTPCDGRKENVPEQHSWSVFMCANGSL